MSFYAVYNPEMGNCLVGLAHEAPEVQPPLLVKGRPDDYPDLSRMEWNPATLSFYAKPTRRLTKLEFVGRLGVNYASILQASKASVDVEMFVKSLDWATPDADGTSVDLDDPRVAGALQMMEAGGILPAGTADTVLA